LTFSSAVGRTDSHFEGPAPPSPGAASPLVQRDVDPDYYPGGVGDEAAAFLDQFTYDPPPST
jgi:hypothetical protein